MSHRRETSASVRVLREKVQSRRKDILNLATRYGASNLRIFQEQRGDKLELDFILDLGSGRRLLDQGGLMMDLQAISQTRQYLACMIHEQSDRPLIQEETDANTDCLPFETRRQPILDSLDSLALGNERSLPLNGAKPQC